TTIPIHNSDDAKRMIAFYKSRWGIEVFFKVLKSGCNIESTQFKFGNRFKACIAHHDHSRFGLGFFFEDAAFYGSN
ncbi:transposase, IS4-like family protein, partial [Leptospira weilii str. Ecochallenge]